MNILIYSYAILNMDKLSWGKTRQIEKSYTKIDEEIYIDIGENETDTEKETSIDDNYIETYVI
jgi:hypothetical protein